MAMKTLKRQDCTKGKTEKIAGSSVGNRTGRGDGRVSGRGAERHAANSRIVGTFVNRLRFSLSLPPPPPPLPLLLLLLGRGVRHGVDAAGVGNSTTRERLHPSNKDSGLVISALPAELRQHDCWYSVDTS